MTDLEKFRDLFKKFSIEFEFNVYGTFGESDLYEVEINDGTICTIRMGYALFFTQYIFDHEGSLVYTGAFE